MPRSSSSDLASRPTAWVDVYFLISPQSVLTRLQMNFGQRYLELETSYIKDEDLDEITLNVSQMPPNANLFQPGPAYVFLVVDGVPAQGEVSADDCDDCGRFNAYR